MRQYVQRHDGSHPSPAALLLSVTLLAHCACFVGGQFVANSELFEQQVGEVNAELQNYLQNLRGLEDSYFPNKYDIPTDYYIFRPPDRRTEFTQNVIFDPCRGHEYHCCNDTFGSPEYERVLAATAISQERTIQAMDDGRELPTERSRRPDDELYIDTECTGLRTPSKRCVMARVAARVFPATPKCWNFNESINAVASCRAPSDGTLLPLCMEVGISQNALIVECAGDYPQCGTYLEVHRGTNRDVLSSVKLKSTFTSGYRMSLLSTTYKRNSSLTLCYDPVNGGQHEVWWVHRTLYAHVVLRRIPFRVVYPLCDFDKKNNRYKGYATVVTADGSTPPAFEYPMDGDALSGNAYSKHVLFSDERFLFSQPRTEGRNGQPGPGMGAEYIPASADTLPADADFFLQDGLTYSYSPERPFYTVRKGVLEPENTPDDVV